MIEGFGVSRGGGWVGMPTLFRAGSASPVSEGSSGMERPSPGVLVIRVWRQESDGAFRARVTRTADVLHSSEATTIVSSPEELEELVHAWLQEYLRTHP